MDNLLVELLNATLCKRPLNEDLFQRAAESEWQQCYEMALEQGVLAMTFPAMSSLPRQLRPPITLWANWMVYMQSVADQSRYYREVVKKMGTWLVEEGLSTTILKGFSLSVHYPDLTLREFSDIDTFSGKDYDAVNACFAKHGVNVNSMDGHHAYLKVDGISVEHHFAFSNTKVKKGLIGPETTLQQLAITKPQPTTVPGICFPNPAFTALFVGWHAYEHFLQEKIEIRHVIDWALSLKQLTEEEAEIVNVGKTNTRWGYFCDTLTAIALHQLELPQDWFPAKECEMAFNIGEKQVQRVWNDIINSSHTAKSNSSNKRRIFIAKRMLKNRWKFKEYADIPAHELLLKEFIGHARGKVSQKSQKPLK